MEELKLIGDERVVCVYEARYEIIRVAKGRIKIVSPEDAVGQKRYGMLPPAPDPINLKRLLELKSRFVTAPRRKRIAAAKKMGITPNRLTRLINLLDMVPEIEESMAK